MEELKEVQLGICTETTTECTNLKQKHVQKNKQF